MSLFKPWMSSKSKRALEAVVKLSDPEKLAEAALHSPHEMTRAQAVKKLTDQTVIEKVAATDTSVYVREQAVESCNDELFLARFACTINHSGLAVTAVNQISNEAFLALIAEKSNSREVSLAAAIKIRDETLLVTVAAGMPGRDAWKIMDKIAEFPDALERFEQLAKSAKDTVVRRDAVLRHARMSENATELLACARAEHGSTQRDLIRHIKDTAILERIAVNDGISDFRACIVECEEERLSNDTLLSFALREDNILYRRSRAAYVLLKRDFSAYRRDLSPVLNILIVESRDLLYLLANNGDPLAIEPLKELAFSDRGDMWTAPRALGRIRTKESVEALKFIVEKNHEAAVEAVKSLMIIFRESKDTDVQNAISDFPQRVYYKHTDMGESSRSCHEDVPTVHFDLAGISS
jgi:hypothetical protein